jgi:SAM-dependent methyltransferase
MSYQYDNAFFDFVNASSGKSARLFLQEFVAAVLLDGQPAGVLDVGCGRGIWLAEWGRRGNIRLLGVDGNYVDPSGLLIDQSCFVTRDISQRFDLGERFELVQCLEVAEHIPARSADTFVDNLVRHGDLVLFSAATPGQGGEFHVNEQPYDYWRKKFADRGYLMYDAIRGYLRELGDIEPWYRYNAFVFANEHGAARISAGARRCLVSEHRPVANVAPLSWRARCLAISILPIAAASSLARMKHRFHNLIASRGRG